MNWRRGVEIPMTQNSRIDDRRSCFALLSAGGSVCGTVTRAGVVARLRKGSFVCRVVVVPG